MQKIEREYMKILKEYNVVVISVRNGRHKVLKCETKNGQKFSTTIPSSPGDVRGIKNFKTDISNFCNIRIS